MSYEILDLDTTRNYNFDDISSLNNCVINNNIKNIKILKTPNFIDNKFLFCCSNLESIDLSKLSNVTKIGNRFLFICSKLESIDLNGLSNVTSIGNSFLSFCYKLESIHLNPLSNVTSIGDRFLYGCHRLKSIDLSPFSNVTEIGDEILICCFNLKSINSRKIKWFYHDKKEEYQQNYDKPRKEFMKEYGLAWELMAVVWHPDNFHKFKYLDPDTFADI